MSKDQCPSLGPCTPRVQAQVQVIQLFIHTEIGIQQLKLNSANNIGEKTTWGENRLLAGLGLDQKPRRRAMAQNRRLDPALPTQGEAVKGNFPKKAMLDQRPYIEWYQVKITTETNRITAANEYTFSEDR